MVKKFSKALNETWQGFIKNKGFMLAAALSFYLLISAVPIIVFTILILNSTLSAESFEFIFSYFSSILIDQNLIALFNILIQSSARRISNFTSTMGVIFFLLGFTALFSHLKYSIKEMWNISDEKATSKLTYVKRFVLDRILPFIFLSIMILLLIILQISSIAFLTLEKNLFVNIDILQGTPLKIINFFVILLIFSVFLSILFFMLSSFKYSYTSTFKGALFTSLLLILGQFILGSYINKLEVINVYGAVGSLLALLIWVYYSSVVFYFGLQFTHCYAKRKVKRIRNQN